MRDRTFYALSRTMTGKVKAALMMFATALRRTGKGTGKGAARHRREARDAIAMCYDASRAGSCRRGACRSSCPAGSAPSTS